MKQQLALASILFESWGVVDPCLKTGGVDGPKNSTGGGT